MVMTAMACQTVKIMQKQAFDGHFGTFDGGTSDGLTMVICCQRVCAFDVYKMLCIWMILCCHCNYGTSFFPASELLSPCAIPRYVYVFPVRRTILEL